MKRIFLHIIFWVIYVFQDALLIFLLNTSRFRVENANFIQAIEHCLILLIPKLLFTYIILYVALEKIVRENDHQSIKAIVLSIVGLISVLFVYRMLHLYVIYPNVYGWADSGESLFNPIEWMVALMDVGFVAGTAIAIRHVRFRMKENERQESLMREKLEAELKYLRSQIHPHFLFNTLNNIYTLARKKSDRTADAVMKLSSLLRFMLYETSKPLVKIAEEIKILDDFIDLEKMRYTSRLSVRFEKVIDNDREHISPLLLLPFVENAFKHGASESRFDSNISISLSLTLHHRVLHFVVENTKENINTDLIPDGLGLSNVKRQLQLLYKDFTMNVYNEPSTFKVELTIKLDSYAKS